MERSVNNFGFEPAMFRDAKKLLANVVFLEIIPSCVVQGRFFSNIDLPILLARLKQTGIRDPSCD